MTAIKSEQREFSGREALLGHCLGISLLVGGGVWLPLHHLFCQAFFIFFPSLKLCKIMSFLTSALPVVSPILHGGQ